MRSQIIELWNQGLNTKEISEQISSTREAVIEEILSWKRELAILELQGGVQ